MNKYLDSLTRFYIRLRSDESGVTVVEYAVMLFLVAIAVLFFGSGIADSVTGTFQQIVTGLNQT